MRRARHIGIAVRRRMVAGIDAIEPVLRGIARDPCNVDGRLIEIPTHSRKPSVSYLKRLSGLALSA
jgi:hypothetical protein